MSEDPVLITGGAGFIGSHVTEALVAKGHDTYVLDNLSSGSEEHVPPEAELCACDIRSPEAAALVADIRPDVLVHHAAQIDVEASKKNPAFDADVNIRGLLNLVEAGKGSLEKVIFASSGGALYGEPEHTPQDVRHPLRPQSPYGVAKLACERYLEWYEAEHSIDYVSLRYANVYGPRQTGAVVPVFIRKMLDGVSPVIDGDGEQTRDFVYVEDVVRANLLALEYDDSGMFNVGTGRETSINELCDAIRAVTASVVRLHNSDRSGGQRRSVLGYDHTEDELGWTPTTTIDEGLTRTAQWWREQVSTDKVLA